jgi:competence protein ComEA
MFRLFLSLVLVSAAVIATPSTGAAAQSSSSTRSSAKAAFTGTLNINTASVEEFEALPGIGAKTAALIVEYRQKNGPFKKVEDLMLVRGIGEKNFLKFKPQLAIAPAKGDKSAHPQGH